MAELFDTDMKKTLGRVREIGFETGHRELTLAHFVVALVEESELPTILPAIGAVDCNQLSRDARNLVGEGPGIPPGGDVTMAADAHRIFQRALNLAHAEAQGPAERRHFLKAVVELASGQLGSLIEESGLGAAVEQI